MALPILCPFCAAIAVVADSDLMHRFGARRYRCPSCQSIAPVEAKPPRSPRHAPHPAPPLGRGDLLRLRALLADESWLAALAGDQRP